MSTLPVPLYHRLRYDIEHSTQVIKDYRWFYLKTKVAAVAANALCISIGITATLYTLRTKSRYTAYSIGTVSFLSILALISCTIVFGKRIATHLNAYISSLEGASKIFIAQLAKNKSANPIEAVGAFHRQTQESLSNYQNDLGKKTRFFKAKFSEAFVIAISQCLHFTSSSQSWITISNKIKSPSGDETFITFHNGSKITCREMQDWDVEKLSKCLIAIMNEIQPPPL